MMKVSIGMNGATPVAPDFAMLKAALVAAQAATPTARANVRHEQPADPHAALHAILKGTGGVAASAAALGHSFNIDASKPEAGHEQS